MIISEHKNTAFTDSSAQLRAPLQHLPPLATPGGGSADAKAMRAAEQRRAAQDGLLRAREHCRLALDNIQMAEMVVRFLEHLLDAKASKNIAACELNATRSSIGQARADLASAQQGYRQACEAFRTAHHVLQLAEGKVCGPSGAAQAQNAQPA